MFPSRLMSACTLIIPALIGFSACTRTDEGTRARTGDRASAIPDTSYVRYVNLLSVHEDTDLYFGDSKLFDPKSHASREYIQAPAERRDFLIRKAGQETAEPIVKNSEGLEKGNHYTVIAFEDAFGRAALRMVNDEESAPASGKAKVRIIDAGARVDAFELYAAGTKDKLAGESRFGSVSRWQQVDPGQGALELKAANDPRTSARITDATIQAGKLYTFIVTSGEAGKEPLRVITLENAPTKLPARAPVVPPVY